eukprot:GHVU01098044.1.p1 GENE.GHVU01098044.1~~GHVU01098044.1.p1  ORF type:complete len:793 (+),score=88.95 GHVU01098044.1:170-2548(+)
MPGRVQEWEHFTKGERIAGTSFFEATCKACDEVAVASGKEHSAPLCGRKRDFVSHLNTCVNFKKRVRQERGDGVPVQSGGEDRSRQSVASVASDTVIGARSQRSSYSHSSFVVDKAFTPQERAHFHRLCLETCAESNLPFDFFNKPATKALFQFTRKAVVQDLPKAKLLSGDLLTKVGMERQETMVPRIQEKVAVEGCALTVKVDGWKDVSSNDVVGTMVGSGSSYFCYDQVLGDTAAAVNRDESFDGLAAARLIEETILPNVQQLLGLVCGAFISDESGELSRAKRILALRYPAVYWGKCFAHQVNRLVGDVLKYTCFNVIAMLAVALVSCISNSKVWRNILYNKCRLLYQRFGLLITATENRWCSAQACFASILRMRKAMQLILLEHCQDLPTALAAVFDYGEAFWPALREAHDVVLALAKSQLVLQRQNGSLGDVVYAYGRFRADMGHRSQLAAQVDKRWLGTEQPLLLLVCSLDKKYVKDFRERCRNSNTVSGIRLSQLAVYYYTRFIGDDSSCVADAFMEWWDGNLPEEKLYNPERFWKVILDHPKPEMRKLARLAQLLCSFPSHTADCERLFSDYGNVKTPERNRMANSKMQLLTQIKHELRDRYRTQQQDQIRQRTRLVSVEPYTERSHPAPNPLQPSQPSSSSSAAEGGRPGGRPPRPPSEVEFDEVEVLYETEPHESTAEAAAAEGWAVRFRFIDEEAAESEGEEAGEAPSDIGFTEAAVGYTHTKGDEHRRVNVLPRVNVRQYPQDKLTGVRAWKVPLSSLFPPGAGVGPAEAPLEAFTPFL